MEEGEFECIACIKTIREFIAAGNIKMYLTNYCIYIYNAFLIRDVCVSIRLIRRLERGTVSIQRLYYSNTRVISKKEYRFGRIPCGVPLMNYAGEANKIHARCGCKVPIFSVNPAKVTYMAR